MQFLLSILIPHLFVLFSTSCNAEDSNWYGNTEVEATEQTNFHLDESIASPIVPGVGELSSLGTPALLLADNTAPLIASDETSCALPKENSQRRKKSRRNGLPNDACVAPMQLQASPPTEKKTNLRQRPGDTNKNPNSGAPGDRKAPHGGPLFESLSWIAPPTLRTGDGRCPDPDRNIPVCASEDDLAFVGIPLDLRFVYPCMWPFLFSVSDRNYIKAIRKIPTTPRPPISTNNTRFSLCGWLIYEHRMIKMCTPVVP